MNGNGHVRVLHVITRMVRGGAQENTLASVAGIRGEGWESLLISGPAVGPEGSLEARCRDAGIPMLHVPELLREISPGQDHRALLHLAQVFRRERPHLVHTHTSKAGMLGRMAARMAGVPAVIHTPHGHVFHSYESRLRSRVFVHAERAGAAFTDRLIALTPAEMREHLEEGVGKPEQWRVIPSGIPFAPFEAAIGTGESVRRALGIPPDVPVIGTVGRLVPIKGQAYLLEAAAALSTEFPRLRLLLAGDGPLREDLILQARALGMEVIVHPGHGAEAGEAPPGLAGVDAGAPREAVGEPLAIGRGRTRLEVHFLGLRKDVPAIMAAMDVFVLPSLNEGMGRVLVEAMCMRLPCVASHVSGIPDVVAHEVTGLLVPPRESGALATAVARLLRDRELRRRLGEAGRGAVVPAYGEGAMLASLAGLYVEVLSSKGVDCPPIPSNVGR